jgi:hypothetical protein
MNAIAEFFYDGDMRKMLECDRMGRPVTPFGQVFLAPAAKVEREEPWDKSDMPGNDADNLDDPGSGAMDGGECAKAIAALVKNGMGFSEAASVVHRLECRAKGLPCGAVYEIFRWP